MDWTCRCGAFAAVVEPRGGTRVVCYCPSCRKFAERTGAEDALDPQGGSDLFQVGPEAMTITRGADRLAWVRLTEKGPLRWYTTCCNTPVANTLERRSIPFITLQSHRFGDPKALGAVTIRSFRRFAKGRVPDDTNGGALHLYFGFARRALKSWLTGGWRRNPLFDDRGYPIASGGPVAD